MSIFSFNRVFEKNSCSINIGYCSFVILRMLIFFFGKLIYLMSPVSLFIICIYHPMGQLEPKWMSIFSFSWLWEEFLLNRHWVLLIFKLHWSCLIRSFFTGNLVYHRSLLRLFITYIYHPMEPLEPKSMSTFFVQPRLKRILAQ